MKNNPQFWIKLKENVNKMSTSELDILSEMVRMAKVRTFSVGDEVIFGRPNGQKHQGVISALGNAKAKITTDAGEWRVPYSLMKGVA